MKARKLIALLLAASMTTMLVACGNGAPSTSDNASDTAETDVTVEAEAPVLEGASIDFEDGNSAFVIEASALKGGDPSTLEVQDVNGSKVLTTTNVFGKNEVFIGIDADALLGEKIADVKTVQFDIGVLGDEFNAISGKVYAYTGEDNNENIIGTHSVYLDTDNPKTVSFDLTESFVVGAGNYIIISKESNAAGTPTEFMLDNIGFYDADGNLIEVDTTVSVADSSPLAATGEPDKGPAYGTTYGMSAVYGGDWGQASVIPASLFENLDGSVSVTVNYSLEDGYEYYLIAPMDAAWTRLVAEDYVDLAPASEGTSYHLQDDGFIVIDDWALDSLSFTLTKDAAAKVVAGGGLSFQVYGVTADSAIISDDTYVCAMEGSYAGDWGGTAVVPAGYFENAEGNVNVTVDFALESGYDYYLIAPMDAAWTRLVAEDYADLVTASEGTSYHLQDDGFIVIDDWALDSLSFTLTKDAAAKVAAGGGLSFQIYGVTTSKTMVSSSVYSCPMEGAYGGDWGQMAVIPASAFEGADGNVGVTIDISLEAGYDYYLMAPMDAAWTRLEATDYVDLVPASEGKYYHLQDDGFIVIDDWAISEVSFTITKDAADKLVAGGGLSCQVYGVTASEATVNKSAYSVPMEGSYNGDWGQSAVVPASLFEGIEGNVNITVDFALEKGYEYYLIGPIRNTTGWPKFQEADFVDLVVAEEGTTFHLQKDGFLPIDDFGITTLSFTLAPSGVEKIVKDGGLSFQIYGATLKNVTITR